MNDWISNPSKNPSNINMSSNPSNINMSSTPIQIRQDEYSAVSLVTGISHHNALHTCRTIGLTMAHQFLLARFLDVFRTNGLRHHHVFLTYSLRIPHVLPTFYLGAQHVFWTSSSATYVLWTSKKCNTFWFFPRLSDVGTRRKKRTSSKRSQNQRATSSPRIPYVLLTF